MEREQPLRGTPHYRGHIGGRLAGHIGCNKFVAGVATDGRAKCAEAGCRETARDTSIILSERPRRRAHLDEAGTRVPTFIELPLRFSETRKVTFSNRPPEARAGHEPFRKSAAVAAPRPLREDDVARSPRRASASRGAAAAADRVETRRRGRDVDVPRKRETADRGPRARLLGITPSARSSRFGASRARAVSSSRSTTSTRASRR